MWIVTNNQEVWYERLIISTNLGARVPNESCGASNARSKSRRVTRYAIANNAIAVGQRKYRSWFNEELCVRINVAMECKAVATCLRLNFQPHSYWLDSRISMGDYSVKSLFALQFWIDDTLRWVCNNKTSSCRVKYWVSVRLAWKHFLYNLVTPVEILEQALYDLVIENGQAFSPKIDPLTGRDWLEAKGQIDKSIEFLLAGISGNNGEEPPLT